MSAVFTNLGVVYLAETARRSSSLGGIFVTETVGAIVDLAGDLAFSVPFAADVTDIHDFVGDLTTAVTFIADLTVSAPSINYVDFAGAVVPSTVFTADLTVVIDTAHYVDFTGNLGGVSLYGRLAYGRGHYSRIDAFAPIFAGTLDIVGQDFFDGDLRPVITFAGALTFDNELAGDLAPQITFAANLGLVIDLAGDLGPQIDLGASLSLDLAFGDGSFGFTVVYAASELVSGPLWDEAEPCPPPDWEVAEPCPPPLWASAAPCPPSNWGSTNPCPPTMWTPTDPDSVEWDDTELCNG